MLIQPTFTLGKYIAHTILVFLLIAGVCGCSVTKNTWITRSYQDINTRFNVYFNGTTSYNEGLENIGRANKEDYSVIIPMYPISRHANAASATSNMDRTIEKCRKAIKLHSIKVKPQKNLKKANRPEYKLFYSQEEFNPALKKAWLLLGQAEFHKGDFLGSVGTFTYVGRHYSTDKDMVAKCQLWIARAYGEMGWIYEAEQVLSKVEQDNIRHDGIGLFASVNADLLLKKKQYKEAVPFLELALAKERDKAMRQRFYFLLAQLYQKTNEKKAAFDAYSKVIRMNPPYEMDFYARINRVQLETGNVSKVRKELDGLLKNKNNKDYLDQIYYALGNTYLNVADTAKAIANYRLAVEKSTRNGNDKAQTLVTLGDIYYLKRNYVQAQPCYDEAAKIIPNEKEDYGRVSRRADVLGELVAQYEIVTLQDSLQRLAALPADKRLEAVNKVIEKMVADEKAAADKAREESQTRGQNPEGDLANLSPIGMNTRGGVGEWYFYNPELIRNGQSEFLKKWGRRKLEDNWRRTNKATSLFADETVTPEIQGDTTQAGPQKEAELADNKNPEFYLRQIPLTPSQINKSNADMATAMFSMGLIYKDKVEDIPMAMNTFQEFVRRFASNERVPDAYFQMYVMQTQLGNTTEANLYRSKLISDFPDSKYKKMLADPDYKARLERMYHEQDSIYSQAYKAYNGNDFSTVFKLADYFQQNYPSSPLMPKLLFLNALSVGKKESPEKFRAALSQLVADYPTSDVSAMAKDILALIKQGQEAKTGTSSGSLLARRESIDNNVNGENALNAEMAGKQFSTDRQGKHRVMLISSDSLPQINRLLYQVASFNFSRFLIKDFDLVVNKLDAESNVLSVTNLESYEEAQWYLNSVGADATLSKLLAELHAKRVIVSEENYALLRNGFSLNDYLAFLDKPAAPKTVAQVAGNKQAKKTEPASPVKEEMQKPTDKNASKATDVLPAKPVEKIPEKPVGKTVAAKTEPAPTEKPAEKQPATATKQADAKQPATTAKAGTNPPANVSAPVVKPKEEEVPLFKNLFAYKPNDPHFVAIYVLSGTVDFNKVKPLFDAYNAQNYGVLNLKVSMENVDKQQVIIIGSLTDAQVAKSYLLRIVKEKGLYDGLKGTTYRNLIGTQKNLNVLMQQNALNTYFEFMQEYYLK
ncbi:MAG TPA: tetratricopeptide repeat protein [Paludibacter sp.]|nr:tetratricopeptide repeat protein [Paludibacter sp.]